MRGFKIASALTVLAVILLGVVVHAQLNKSGNVTLPTQAGQRFLLFQGSYAPVGQGALAPQPCVLRIDTLRGPCG